MKQYHAEVQCFDIGSLAVNSNLDSLIMEANQLNHCAMSRADLEFGATLNNREVEVVSEMDSVSNSIIVKLLVGPSFEEEAIATEVFLRKNRNHDKKVQRNTDRIQRAKDARKRQRKARKLRDKQNIE